MKSVLMSIQPKWCELIASGKKRVEVRKTKPKLETPFKVYIYCTKDNTFAEKTLRGFDDSGKAIYYKANKGKVIGEFVCDSLIWVLAHPSIFAGHPLFYSQAINDACLTQEEVEKYSGGKNVYGWHISDLKIYDKPRELSEFKNECNGVCVDTKSKVKCEKITVDGFSCNGLKPLKRAPQSWCYVESEDTK